MKMRNKRKEKPSRPFFLRERERERRDCLLYFVFHVSFEVEENKRDQPTNQCLLPPYSRQRERKKKILAIMPNWYAYGGSTSLSFSETNFFIVSYFSFFYSFCDRTQKASSAQLSSTALQSLSRGNIFNNSYFNLNPSNEIREAPIPSAAYTIHD